ncbi:MAG TPA: hypothetical protein ENJ18_17665 [Nannocystis exedens]|nr:hypothetical protein [Nannocystis exedens]
MACAPAPVEIPFEVVETSNYLCLGAAVSGAFCDANVAILDEQVEFVASFLDIPTPEQCIPTLWTEDPEDLAECGGKNSGGCYEGGIIRSGWTFLPHELVHAVGGRAGFDGPSFIREGLAEALSGRAFRSNGLGAEEIIERGTKVGLSAGDYESVGHFTAWMIDYFGRELVVQLYSRLDRDVDKDEAIDVIEDTFGLPFSSLAAAYADALGTIYAGKGPFSCGATAAELSWDGNRTVEEVEFSCESGEDFRRLDLGQYAGYTEELWRPYRADLSGGEYQFKFWRNELYAYAILEACLTEDTEEEFLPTPPAPVLTSWGGLHPFGFFMWHELPSAIIEPGGVILDLPAGIYTLWVGWVKDPEPTIVVTTRQSFSIEQLN